MNDMNDADERIHIDFERMFPEAARRVHILDELKRSWSSVVGDNTSRHSSPCVLGVNAITVSVDSDRAAIDVRNSKGNIMRALSSRFGCETNQDFALTVVVGNYVSKFTPR